MNKVFKDIIRNIKNKEDEIWENNNAIIHISYMQICIRFKANCTETLIDSNDIFTLQRKEYDFDEAYRSHKEGKEIESLQTGCRYKIIDDNNVQYGIFNKSWEESEGVKHEEISNKWYIND